VQVFLPLRVKSSRLGSRREHGVPSSCVCWQAGFTAQLQVMASGSAQRLQGQGIRSGEMQIVIPAFPVVNYFSICLSNYFSIQGGLCFSLVMGLHGCLLGSLDLPSSG
jgi:hypothetical protein